MCGNGVTEAVNNLRIVATRSGEPEDGEVAGIFVSIA